jgi:hypothetical protein
VKPASPAPHHLDDAIHQNPWSDWSSGGWRRQGRRSSRRRWAARPKRAASLTTPTAGANSPPRFKGGGVLRWVARRCIGRSECLLAGRRPISRFAPLQALRCRLPLLKKSERIVVEQSKPKRRATLLNRALDLYARLLLLIVVLVGLATAYRAYKMGLASIESREFLALLAENSLDAVLVVIPCGALMLVWEYIGERRRRAGKLV